ncbi:DUF1963 domain-containing protein [Actinomadura alba]|uniref:DUF1963 domain-containing protein n=1 Tax=Actinomadura alba TaxID=406431 RepID=A0ABR7LJS0_9ACTN|nr:DUF1963 domain-containing protein [Actinomadura alba]MBC6464638.1 DUF1963 domain-containing protein [Actinomadura alba]
MDYESSLAEIRELCLEHLGERLGPQMAALAKRGVVLKPATDEAPPTGRCQARGAALLEPGTPWPENRVGVPLSPVAVLDTDEFVPWLGDELPSRLGLVNIFSVEPDPQYDGDPRYTETLERYRKWGDRCDTDLDCQIILADPECAVEVPAPPPASTFERRPLHAAPVITLPSVAGEMADPVLKTFDYRAEPEFDEDDWLPPRERFIQEPFREVWYDYCRSRQGFRNEEGWFRPDQAFGWPYIDSWLMEEKEEEYTHLLTLSGDVLWPYGDGFGRVMVPASALSTGEFANVAYETDGLH